MRANFGQIMELTCGWTGAEIEQCVISALTKARLAEREATENALVNSVVGGVPLARDEGANQPHPAVDLPTRGACFFRPPIVR